MVIIVIIIAIIAILIVRNGTSSDFENEKVEAVKEAKEEFQQQIDDMQRQISKLQAETTTEADGVTSQSIVPTNDKAIGYISRVYEENGSKMLEIDYIQWLAGDEALKAMKEDGECKDMEDSCVVENDHYIRNQNELLRTFKIAEDSKILMQTYKLTERGSITWDEEISYEDFMNVFSDNNEEQTKNVPYHIEIEGDIIVKIAEQYVP